MSSTEGVGESGSCAGRRTPLSVGLPHGELSKIAGSCAGRRTPLSVGLPHGELPKIVDTVDSGDDGSGSVGDNTGSAKKLGSAKR